MTQDFVVFKKLHDTEIGRQFIDALKDSGIEAQVNDVPSLFDTDNNENETASEVTIKLHREDFSKAAEILRGVMGDLLKNIDKDYYLFALSKEELDQMVNKHHINEFDLLLAQQILRERKE